MLNPFPLQFLALLAYFVLRVAAGFILLWLGVRHYRHRQELAAAIQPPLWPRPKTAVIILAASEFLAGMLLLLGLYTQIGAIIAFAISVKLIVWHRRFAHPLIPERPFFFLLAAVALSLFVTGGGAFAFDLPI
jgi:uncharacterized membrane protein YphA (DoxX/SURF4 family)